MIIDIVFLVILLYGSIQGVRKGLFSEISTLLGIFAGIWGAINFSEVVGEYVSLHLKLDAVYISLISFGLTFVGILIGVFMIGKFITKIFETLYLGVVNKLLGGLFGFLKFTLILSVIIMIFDSINNKIQIVKQSKVEKSILYNPIKEAGSIVVPKVRKVLNI